MKKQLVILLILFLTISIIWEFSHAGLYDWDHSSLQTSSKNQQLLNSIIGDVMYLVIIFAIVSIVNKNLKWIKDPDKNEYTLIFILGIIFATLIELKAFILGKWAYLSIMPTLFGIGLTPLIQFAIIGTLSLFLSKKLS